MKPRTPHTDSKLAVAYLRTSTSDQTLGIEAQRTSIQQWAERHHVQVIAWHQEHQSGSLTSEERPELHAALVSLETHRAGVFVVARRDRLARDVAIARIVEKQIDRRGAHLVSVAGEGSDDSGPSGEFMRTIIDATAQWELALVRSRTKAGLAVRKARGLRTGTVPLGYTADSNGVLATDEREQKLVTRIQELLTIGHTINELTATLAREGYVSRKGRPLSRSRVGAICTKLRQSTGQNNGPNTNRNRP